MRGMGVSRPQHSRHGEARDPVQNQKRMIHMLLVITVKETQLLGSMGGIIGGVDVNHDHIPGARMHLQIQAKQSVGQSPEVFFGDTVLKTTKGWLRGQIQRSLRKPA